MMQNKTDYIESVEWVENKFINASGMIRDAASSHYMKNSVALDTGKYVLRGKNGDTATRYRIHAYDNNDNWLEIIEYYVNGITGLNTQAQFQSNETVYIIFNVPLTGYNIRLSINKDFVGTLTKV